MERDFRSVCAHQFASGTVLPLYLFEYRSTLKPAPELELKIELKRDGFKIFTLHNEIIGQASMGLGKLLEESLNATANGGKHFLPTLIPGFRLS